MSERWTRWVAAAGLGLVLAAANAAVWDHENTLAAGRVLVLELAPADPRSIMQGDYMALRFRVGVPIAAAPGHASEGRAVLKLAPDGLATFERLHAGEPLAPDEALLEYRIRDGRARIVTDAYFFQEGQAPRYAGARFGELRARPDGQALLVRLQDAQRRPL